MANTMKEKPGMNDRRKFRDAVSDGWRAPTLAVAWARISALPVMSSVS